MLPVLVVLLSSLVFSLAAWAIAREMNQPRWSPSLRPPPP